MKVVVSNYIKKNLYSVASCTDDGKLSIVFDGDKYYFVGNVSTYSEIFRLDSDENNYGCYSIPSDLVKYLVSYDEFEIILEDVCMIFKMYKDGHVISNCKIGKEESIDHASIDIVNGLAKVKNLSIYDLNNVGKFVKVLPLIKDGLIFSNGYMMASSDNLRVYAKVDNRLNLAVSSNVVKRIAKLIDKSSLIADLGNKMVYQRNDYYFEFNKYRNKKRIDDFDVINSQEVLAEYSLSVPEILINIHNFTSTKLMLSINHDTSIMTIKQHKIIINTGINIKDKKFKDTDKYLNVSLKLFKSILGIQEGMKEMKVRVYSKFSMVSIGSMMFVIKNEKGM